MITSTYSISFDFPLESSHLSLSIKADVEVHHSLTHYIVKNFRAGLNPDHAVLPDISIKKLNNRWVHTDSEKETRLSTVVGYAIDHSEITESFHRHKDNSGKAVSEKTGPCT